MATSTLTFTRNDLIRAVAEKIGVAQVGQAISSLETTKINTALNLAIKAVALKGLTLWCTQYIVLPLTGGKNTYSVGPGSADLNIDRPIKIVGGYIRQIQPNNVNIDTQLLLISRQEYDSQSIKSITGLPTMFYHDNQWPSGWIFVFPTPPSNYPNGLALVLTGQRPFADSLQPADVLDFPAEAWEALVWRVAGEIAIDYGRDIQTVQYLRMEGERRIQELFDESVEEASVFFTADPRMRMDRAY